MALAALCDREMPCRFPAAFFTFTGVSRTNSAYGERFAEFIEKEGLGTVTASERAKNPNSGNYIRIWTWKIDHPALTKWWAKRRKGANRG